MDQVLVSIFWLSHGHDMSWLLVPPQPPDSTSPTFLKQHTPKVWALSHLCSSTFVSFKTLDLHCPVDWVLKARNIIYMIHNLNTFKDDLFLRRDFTPWLGLAWDYNCVYVRQDIITTWGKVVLCLIPNGHSTSLVSVIWVGSSFH